MVLCLKHSHNSLTANIYRSDPVCWCDMSLVPVVRARKAVETAHAGLGSRPPPNRPGAPRGHGNRFALLNVPGHSSGANLAGAHNALMLNNQACPPVAHVPGDSQDRAVLAVLTDAFKNAAPPLLLNEVSYSLAIVWMCFPLWVCPPTDRAYVYRLHYECIVLFMFVLHGRVWPLCRGSKEAPA
jgi:hypothetical protein